MSSDELSISVEGLSKRYEIYSKPVDRLKQMALPRMQHLLRRPERTYFEQFWALRDVSFTVQRGETVGIIGCNGSGKSTLLQMVCGTLHPTLGKVETFGRIAALLELGAGFNPEFTGRENIRLSGLLYGISESELRRRYESIVEFADIGEFINQSVKTYSSGMYVRLAFAIAAHMDADVLVVDEALSVGDVRFTQKCMRFLRDFQKHGTLLFVSHDSGAVVNLCQRAIWLDKGHKVADGSAREVVEQYLAEQHAMDRASHGDHIVVRAPSAVPQVDVASANILRTEDVVLPKDVVDPRKDVLNGVAARNLIEVFEFDDTNIDREFGAGDVRIVDVRLRAAGGDGNAIQLIAGGEAVDLEIEAEVLDSVSRPIFGFYVKDRLGQRLFGDNTYVTYCDRTMEAVPGSKLLARFRFRMPILAAGDYAVDVAVATGTQEDHTQQHWIRDAVVFKANESTMRHGLVGIPMHKIEIEQIEA